MRAGLAMLALSLAGLALTPSQVLSPRIVVRSIAFAPSTFPVLSLSLLGFLAALMVIRAWFGPTAEAGEPPEGQLRLRVLLPMGIFLLYVLLIEPVGMYVATVLAVVAFALALGVRHWAAVSTLAAITPVFIWMFFERTLGVGFPEGSLFGGAF
jgi:hypothetical protein